MSIFKRKSHLVIVGNVVDNEALGKALGNGLLSVAALLAAIVAIFLESAARVAGIAVLLTFIVLLFVVAIWGPFSVSIVRDRRSVPSKDAVVQDDRQLVLIP